MKAIFIYNNGAMKTVKSIIPGSIIVERDTITDNPISVQYVRSKPLHQSVIGELEEIYADIERALFKELPEDRGITIIPCYPARVATEGTALYMIDIEESGLAGVIMEPYYYPNEGVTVLTFDKDYISAEIIADALRF